eukprot:scaffold66925_cov42-Phaeocystis_antarctica.AAC.1
MRVGRLLRSTEGVGAESRSQGARVPQRVARTRSRGVPRSRGVKRTRLRLVMAIADTAESAVAEKHRVDILLIKEALVLVGPERGLEFELGGKKFKVPPMLKANPPPDK